MEECEKLAVFDLDGTLYYENSHVSYLNYIYKTHFFSSICSRGIGFLFPHFHLRLLWWMYEHRKYDAKNFLLPFRLRVVELLKKKKSDGWRICILSNAPVELLYQPAKKLQADAIHAPIGRKQDALKEMGGYKQLFVCTDNATDIDLLLLADQSVVLTNKRNAIFFRSSLKGKEVEYWAKEEM